MVNALGKFPLPIEITKMAYTQSDLAKDLLKLGGTPKLRMDKNTQAPVITEHGNYILDVLFNEILNPAELYQNLIKLSDGHILTNGLFINNHAADLLIIAQKKAKRGLLADVALGNDHNPSPVTAAVQKNQP